MEGKCAWGAEQFPQLARRSDPAQRPTEACRGCCEPYLIAGRRPRQAESAGPALRQIGLLTIEINHAYSAAIVAQQVVIDKSQAITLGRESRVADPAGGFVKHLADRVLQPAFSFNYVNRREGIAVRVPIRSLHIVQQVAWSVRADRKLSQRANMGEVIVAQAKAAHYGHLPRGGNGQHLCSGESKIAGFGGIRRADINSFRTSLPSSAVDRRAWVRGKPRCQQGATTETQFTK